MRSLHFVPELVCVAIALSAASMLGACMPADEMRFERAPTTNLTAAELAPDPNYRPSSIALYVAQQAPEPCGGERTSRITFDTASAEVNEADDLRLNQLARCFGAPEHAQSKIVVVGYAGLTGAAGSSDRGLALRRAEGIKKSLVAH